MEIDGSSSLNKIFRMDSDLQRCALFTPQPCLNWNFCTCFCAVGCCVLLWCLVAGILFGVAGSSQPFHWHGAGQRLFGASPGKDDGAAGEDAADGEVAPSDDVHFEPVIPLPDLVQVKTGQKALHFHIQRRISCLKKEMCC